MNAQVPHSIAEFVTESGQHVIRVLGLPPGVKPKDAARKFSNCTVMLQPLPWNHHYFFGFVGERSILTVDGRHVFTLHSPNTELNSICFPLTIESEGLKILESL